MPQIRRTTAEDVLTSLPELVPWTARQLNRTDVLICCAGFEPRASALCAELRSSDCHVVLVEYRTNQTDNATGANEWIAGVAAERLHRVAYSGADFLPTLRRTLEALSIKSVTVDVSGMASYVIYRVLWALFRDHQHTALTIHYAEAEDYAPTKNEWDAFFGALKDPSDARGVAEAYEAREFQSRGIEEAYESDVFPGRNDGPRATEFVMVPSFSLHRAKAMLTFAEAQYNVRSSGVHWLLGEPPPDRDREWRVGALAKLYGLSTAYQAASTLDYRDIFRQLQSLWQAAEAERHIVIGIVGSKMQHVGCYLFLEGHPDCGLVLSEPREFIASTFSQGVGQRWCLRLGAIAQLRALLTSVGNLEFMWSDAAESQQ
jgi:hypothetical protein